jgi:hypothetical protein
MKLLGVELVEKGSSWREPNDELWMSRDERLRLHKETSREGTHWSAIVSVYEQDIQHTETGSTPEEAESKLCGYLERLAQTANDLRNFAKDAL